MCRSGALAIASGANTTRPGGATYRRLGIPPASTGSKLSGDAVEHGLLEGGAQNAPAGCPRTTGIIPDRRVRYRRFYDSAPRPLAQALATIRPHRSPNLARSRQQADDLRSCHLCVAKPAFEDAPSRHLEPVIADESGAPMARRYPNSMTVASSTLVTDAPVALVVGRLASPPQQCRPRLPLAGCEQRHHHSGPTDEAPTDPEERQEFAVRLMEAFCEREGLLPSNKPRLSEVDDQLLITFGTFD